MTHMTYPATFESTPPPHTASGTGWRLGLLALVLSLAACGGSSSHTDAPPVHPDTDSCAVAPTIENPEPGSADWKARDEANIACSQQRIADLEEQPAELFSGNLPALDVYREPSRHDNKRFRYTLTTTPNRAGKPITVEIYRPCDSNSCLELPSQLERHDGPYPAVVIVHGGGSSRRVHWASAQALAEAGYMTVALDTTAIIGTHGVDTEDVIEWLFSTPTAPLANGNSFPYWQDLNRDLVGIAGHSQGASTASLIGQIDPRFSAIVAWDNLTTITSGWVDRIGISPPADVAIRTPALGFSADYYFTPTVYEEAPEPATSNTQGGRGRGAGPHPKDLGYNELKAAKVDTMLLILRAGTHLDYSPLGGGASRYGEAVINYYTLAWFDRYLKGKVDADIAEDAFRRLTAARFDDSYDRHNISQGRYDPELATAADPYLGNLPYLIKDMDVRNRLSFYFKSRCDIGQPGSSNRATSEDIRDGGGCTVAK